MRKLIVIFACLGLAGCSWFGWDSSSSESVPPESGVVEVTEEVAVVEPVPQESKTAKTVVRKESPKTTGAAKKGSARSAKSEDQIRTELDQVGRKLASQAKRTVTPSKANPQVRKVGKEYVATYTDVDADNVSTELRPGKGGQYVGFIRYQEHVYECRGSTEKAARSATCTQTRTRRLNELIRYDGKSWQF